MSTKDTPRGTKRKEVFIMTTRQKLDRKFKRLCNLARWIRKHINHKLGQKMLDIFRDKWSDSFN